MSYSITPNLGLKKPTPGADDDQWGTHWNENATILDTAFGSTSVVDVLDHGAKGDGVTDDTAAIQAVLNTYAGKAVVFIPDTGNSFTTIGLTIPSGTDLLLSGVLKGRNTSSGYMLQLNAGQNITIRGHGTIDCDGAALSSGLQAGIVSTTGAANIHISGITVRDAKSWNLNICGASRVRVNNARMLGGFNANEFAIGCDDCWFTNCTIDGPANDFGISFYGGITNSGAIGNVVKNSSLGIFVYSDTGQPAACKNITISDNFCFDNFSSGIAVDNSSGVTHEGVIIANNRVYNNNTGDTASTSEIYVDHTNSAVISGNLISDEATTRACANGIGLGTNATQITVTGNSIVNIGKSGRPGTGLSVASNGYVAAFGNSFHDYRATKYMTAIGGTAGAGSVFGPNLYGALLAPAVATSILPVNAANDAAAATAGVPVGGEYRNGSVKMIRTA